MELQKTIALLVYKHIVDEQNLSLCIKFIMETIREGDAVSFFNSNLDDYIFLYPTRLATYTHTHTHTHIHTLFFYLCSIYVICTINIHAIYNIIWIQQTHINIICLIRVYVCSLFMKKNVEWTLIYTCKWMPHDRPFFVLARTFMKFSIVLTYIKYMTCYY